MCPCVSMWRLEVNVGCLQCFPPFILRLCQSLNLILDDDQQVRWGGKHSPDLASTWVPWFHNQVLMLTWQFFFFWNNAFLCTHGWPKTMLPWLVLNSSQPLKWKGWDCRYVSPCWPILPWQASCPGMHGSSWERWAWLTETSLPHICLFYVPTAAPCVCVPNMMT